MFQCAQRWMLIICLLSISGGQWAMLRTVAWTSMTWKNAESLSTWQAISKTFDGSDPCKICLWLAKEKQSPQSPVAFAYSQFLQDFLLSQDQSLSVSSPCVEAFSLKQNDILCESQSPPEPPPPRFFIS